MWCDEGVVVCGVIWCTSTGMTFSHFLLDRAHLKAYGEIYFRSWRFASGPYLKVSSV